MVKTKKKKDKSISKLKKELDDWYSKYIRLKDASFVGMVRCVTCGKQLHWKDAQNGHFVSRSYLILRWDDRNCHVQDCSCNVFKSGNMTEYAEFMIKTYGEGIISELNREKHKIFKLERTWLVEKIGFYKKKVAELSININ